MIGLTNGGDHSGAWGQEPHLHSNVAILEALGSQIERKLNGFMFSSLRFGKVVELTRAVVGGQRNDKRFFLRPV